MYVDDFCICFRLKNMRTIERHLQQCLNRIEDWATRNGFKFSKSKTHCVHFCQQRKIHNDPALYIYESQIPVFAESKCLGIIFGRKLSFIPHIKYVKAKCLKALNLLKVLSHTSWGADRTTLLHLYRSLIRSKLDYGSIVYGSAKKSYLQILDTVHNQGLRLALGAFRTSPVSCLNVEADEPSIWLRREKLSLQYAIRLALLTLLTLLFRSHFHNNFPWVLNFPPCRGPGGSIPTGNVASLVSSNCPLWEERRGNTTHLPWVASRKLEEGVLAVEGYLEYGISDA